MDSYFIPRYIIIKYGQVRFRVKSANNYESYGPFFSFCKIPACGWGWPWAGASVSYWHISSFILFMPHHQKSGGVLCYTFWNFECPSVHQHPHHSSARNSSYSFRPILFKLYRRFKDGLKICILFLQNPEIIFYHIFCIFNLDFFRALILQKCIGSMYLLPTTPPTVLGQSFSNFTGSFRMVWRYAYCFFRILKLFFITFFAFLT